MGREAEESQRRKSESYQAREAMKGILMAIWRICENIASS